MDKLFYRDKTNINFKLSESKIRRQIFVGKVYHKKIQKSIGGTKDFGYKKLFIFVPVLKIKRFILINDSKMNYKLV